MPPFPATPLPYAPSAVQAIVEPQMIEDAQRAAWETCKEVGSHVATSAVSSGVTAGAALFAAQFSASNLSNDLSRLELSLTRMLGELEVRFILGVIDNRSEGFLDLLAAYNSLVLENNAPRLELINMAGWRRNVDCMSQVFKTNKFTVARMEALLSRCKETREASDTVMRARGERSIAHVPLAYGYHPSGNAPWRCPVPHMPVRHIWIYDCNGHPLHSKTVKAHYVICTDGYMEAAHRSTRHKVFLYSRDKARIPFEETMSYQFAEDKSTGLAYVRELSQSYDANGRPFPLEPPRKAPSVWPPVQPLVPVAAPAPLERVYYAPENNAPRPTTTQQYAAQPQLSNFMASSSSRPAVAQPAAIYPPQAHARVATGTAAAHAYHGPPPSSRERAQVVANQPAPTIGMQYAGRDFGHYPNHVNGGN